MLLIKQESIYFLFLLFSLLLSGNSNKIFEVDMTKYKIKVKDGILIIKHEMRWQS
jgi:hypothetical protein